ncbi:MAG: tRNA adenosine(34) deaminase TadA [Thermodesulfobacteriota bacterium]|nr:tRNA adenosine(34) deaminase TadA [Thermodesulfobacteriota bacterium]
MNQYPILPPGWDNWEQIMKLALKQARIGEKKGEVPVGAVVLDKNGQILAKTYNAPISQNDPSAHAEILSLRKAGKKIGNYRLTGCVLAVTCEPCLMCLGALVHARVAGLVFGARDPKAGAVVSRMQGTELEFLNHCFPVLEGVLAQECGDLLSRFFQVRR